MLSNNIIKLQEKTFHVEEDFFEEMINGLQTEKEREESRGESRPVIMMPKQARYFKKTTIPILVKQFQRNGALENYFRTEYETLYQNRKTAIQREFVRAFGHIYQADDEVSEIEEDMEKDKKGLSIGNIWSLYKWMVRASRIYVALKKYERTDDMKQFSLSNYDFRDVDALDRFERDFGKIVGQQKDVLVPVFVELIKPVAKELIVMYDSALEKLFTNLYVYCLKKAIVPDDWLDWSLLALEVGAAIISQGKSLGASAKLRMARFANAVRKIATSLTNAVKGIKGLGRTLKIGAAIGRGAVKGAKWMMPTYTKTRRGRTVVKGKWKLKSARTIWGGIDLLHVTKEDVEDYRRYFQRRSRIWGMKFEAKISDDLARIGETAGDLTKGFQQIGEEISRRRKQEEGSNDELILQRFTNKFGRKISFDGFYDLTLVKTLGYFRDKIDSIFENVGNELGKEMDVSMQIERQKVTMLYGEGKIPKWVDLSYRDSDYKDVGIEIKGNRVGGGNIFRFSANNYRGKLEIWNGNTFVKEIIFKKNLTKDVRRDKRLGNFLDMRIKEGTFKRYYTNGVATGFSVLLEKKKVDEITHYRQQYLGGKVETVVEKIESYIPLDLTQYQDNIQYLIKGNSEYAFHIKRQMEVHCNKDGVLVVNCKPFERVGFWIYNIIQQKPKELEQEEKMAKNINIILDRLTRKMAGLTDYDKSRIEEVLKILGDNQTIMTGTRTVYTTHTPINPMGYSYSTVTTRTENVYENVKGYDANRWRTFLQESDSATVHQLLYQLKNLPSDPKLRFEKINALTNTYIGGNK